MIRLLGGTELATTSGWSRLGPAKRSCVLAALALSAGTPVSLATLTDRVWGSGLPSSAHSTLYGHIAHLRALLRRCPEPVEIHKHGPDGYLLDVPAERVDVQAIRSLSRHARQCPTPAEAVVHLREASELIRGEALAGIGGDWAEQTRTGIRREHATVLTELCHAELALGRHEVMAGALSEWVAEFPLAEGLVECLMTALYRCGRPAEALDAYGGFRVRLADRLGADPGRPLQDLHRRILNQDPALDGSASVSGSPPLSNVDAVPAQLPAAPRPFTGRDAELSVLDSDLGDANGPRLWTVTGPGGVGKSWLALHWARRHRADFGDGQLYVNLHGFDPATGPASPEIALRGLLESLGVAPAAVPTSLDAMAARFRGLTADKRMLILLDDARDAAQVVGLLPGDSGCRTLVTGRTDLEALSVSHGARNLRLDTMDDAQARELLSRRLGAARVSADPASVAGLLAACAGLPLALGVLAARAASRPDIPLANLAEALGSKASALDVLDTGDLSANLRAVFAGSVAALRPAAARVFALFGVAPGNDASRHALASLAGLRLDRIDTSLWELERANLVDRDAGGRFRMHDLTRLYAAEFAGTHLAEPERDDAVRRVVEHYLGTALIARQWLTAGRPLAEPEEPVDGTVLPTLDDLEAVKAWFAAENANVIAAQHLAACRGWDDKVWNLAAAMDTHHDLARRDEDGILMWNRALAAGERLGDVEVRMSAHSFIGQWLAITRRPEAALEHARHMLELAREYGDPFHLARAHYAVSFCYEPLDDFAKALKHSRTALEFMIAADRESEAANVVNVVGWDYAHLGEYAKAREYCERALTMVSEERDVLAAYIRDSLGYIAFHDGRHRDAIGHYAKSIEISRRFGAHEEEPRAMGCLAEVHEAVGEPAQAARLRREAIDLYESQGFAERAAELRTPAAGSSP